MIGKVFYLSFGAGNIYAGVLTSKSVAAEASFSVLQTLSPVFTGAGILRAGELVEILIPGKKGFKIKYI